MAPQVAEPLSFKGQEKIKFKAIKPNFQKPKIVQNEAALTNRSQIFNF